MALAQRDRLAAERAVIANQRDAAQQSRRWWSRRRRRAARPLFTSCSPLPFWPWSLLPRSIWASLTRRMLPWLSRPALSPRLLAPAPPVVLTPQPPPSAPQPVIPPTPACRRAVSGRQSPHACADCRTAALRRDYQPATGCPRAGPVRRACDSPTDNSNGAGPANSDYDRARHIRATAPATGKPVRAQR